MQYLSRNEGLQGAFLWYLFKKNSKIRRGNRKPKTDKQKAEDLFLACAEAILDGYEDRLKYDLEVSEYNKGIREQRANGDEEAFDTPLLEVSPPYDQAEGFLKREAYALLKDHLPSQAGRKLIKSIITNNAMEPRYPSFRENPYYWGLLAMTAPNRPGFGKRLSRQRLLKTKSSKKTNIEKVAPKRGAFKNGLFKQSHLSRMAKQFKYAAKNHVPPEYLVGFLYQIRGAANLSEKLAAGKRDLSKNRVVTQDQFKGKGKFP